MRFAIVDDEEVFRSQIEKAIYKLCGPENAACYLYADGKSLLTSIDNGNRFDAIFLDIEMEEIDGMSTARTLRDNNNNTPIILLDDVLSELDKENKTRLINYLPNGAQIIVTNTDISNVEINRRYKLINLEEGGEHV